MMSEHDAVRPVYHPDVNTEKTASTLTFLQPLGNQSAGKEYQWDGNSWKLRSGYGNAMYFRCSLVQVNSLLEWHDLLQRIAQRNVFLIMGLPAASANLKRMTRRVRPHSFVDQNGEHKDEAATLADRAGYLLPFDFDSPVLGQTLRAWSADAAEPLNAVCVCSDPEVSKKKTKNEDAGGFSTIDLALPASTNPAAVRRQLERNWEGGQPLLDTLLELGASDR